MDGKTIKILIAVLILVAGIWVIQNQMLQSGSRQVGGAVKFDPSASSSEINRIVIERGAEKSAMTLKDGIWFVETDKPLGDDRAIQEDAKKLVELLDGVNSQIVSTNEAKHTSLQVDEVNGGRLMFYKLNSSDPDVTLRFNNSNGKYIRQDKMVNVYELNSDYARILTRPSVSWIEPTPIPTAAPSGEVNESSQ